MNKIQKCIKTDKNGRNMGQGDRKTHPKGSLDKIPVTLVQNFCKDYLAVINHANLCTW